MNSPWVDPIKLANSVYSTLNNSDKEKVKSNLSNYGQSIFRRFGYSTEECGVFIRELSRLLN